MRHSTSSQQRLGLLIRMWSDEVSRQRDYAAGNPDHWTSTWLLTMIAAQAIIWMKWQLSGLSRSTVPVYSSRFELLEAAARLAKNEGLRLEFGVFNGESINLLSTIDRNEWFGFDSFEGLPSDYHPWLPQGTFTTHGSVPKVRPNVTLIKGLFSESVPAFLEAHSDAPTSFIHVDCDLYSSTLQILSFLNRRIRDGTIIVFDEFASILPDDEARALREWAKLTGHRFEFVGCSTARSVAIKLVK